MLCMLRRALGWHELVSANDQPPASTCADCRWPAPETCAGRKAHLRPRLAQLLDNLGGCKAQDAVHNVSAGP